MGANPSSDQPHGTLFPQAQANSECQNNLHNCQQAVNDMSRSAMESGKTMNSYILWYWILIFIVVIQTAINIYLYTRTNSISNF
jgi:hypothetical protein